MVANDSLLPIHWQSYYNLANTIDINAVALGIDVTDNHIERDENRSKLNLQEKNCTLFKASCYKYQHVNSESDIGVVLDWFIGEQNSANRRAAEDPR